MPPKLSNQDYQIRLKRGTAAKLTSNENTYGLQGEPFYATDTKELYIHDGTEYVKVNGLTITPIADSTYDLGSSSNYYANLYTDRIYLNSTAYIDGASAGELVMEGTLIADKLMQIDAPTGNPEFNFKENGTTRAKVYYDIANDRLVFQNNQNNNDDAIYFTDSLEITGKFTTGSGRIKNTTRVTTTYTILVTDEVIFANTDSAGYTVTLPAGVEGQTFIIKNTGSSGNTLTIAPNGSEHLLGANSNSTLSDAEDLEITYNATDGWY